MRTKPKHDENLYKKNETRKKKKLKNSPGVSSWQGAALVTEQSCPVAAIVEEQQSLASSPGMLPHPAPPHCPQAASQHTSLLSIPARPLLQVEFVSKATARTQKKKEK